MHSVFGKTVVATLLTLAVSTYGLAATSGNWKFIPLKSSAETGSLPEDKPFKLPKGYSQSVLIDEATLNIYNNTSSNGADWPDMNTVNETGKHAGRYLYRTHEVRPDDDLEAYEGGALSIIDMRTGKAWVLAQRKDWEALDGIVWTPWQTILFAEEAGMARLSDPDEPFSYRGLLYEAKPNPENPYKLDWIKVRPMLGSMSHEGIEIDGEGNIYVIDEHKQGAIYKFVPKRYGKLDNGQLYALKLDSGDTGTAKWVPLDMDQAQTDARTAASDINASSYCRPEDLERIGNTLYVALTCDHAVLSIKLIDTPKVDYFIKEGVNAPVESGSQAGFHGPDNLAKGPDGRLWIAEDNKPSDIWVASPDYNNDGKADKLELFGSLSTAGAEASGLYFGLNPRNLFVNVQHTGSGNDKTIVINPVK
jgi:hypothetical protein